LRGAWYAAPSDAMFDQLPHPLPRPLHDAPYRLASLGYDSVLLAVRVAEGLADRPAVPRARRCAIRTALPASTAPSASPADGIAERSLEVREVTATGTTLSCRRRRAGSTSRRSCSSHPGEGRDL
jgi:branched-chain amino acid transport system substrate-binding protein